MQESDDARRIREWLESVSSEEAQDAISPFLGTGLGGWALDDDMPELPEPPKDTPALTVRVDVDDVRPPVWRRLVLHGDLTLDELHEILQSAFDWEDYHLHRFWPGSQKRAWGGPSFVTEDDVLEGEEGVLESDVRLDQLLRDPGDKLFYTYDFGDDWTHTIKLESVAALDPESPRAWCTGGRMAGPLEDSGGSWGHQQLVDAYRTDPSLRDLDADLREWLPAEWDPTEFSVGEVNDRLLLIAFSDEE